jgi:hypothetical protein
MAGKVWAKGDVAWVRDPDGEHYLATLNGSPYDCDDGDRRVLVSAADGEWDVRVQDISLERPKDDDEDEEDNDVEFEIEDDEEEEPAGKKPSSKNNSKGKKVFAVKDTVWVKEPKKDAWRGKIVEIEPKGRAARITIGQGHQGAGNTVVVPSLASAWSNLVS